jgi:hypothetical protein
MLIWNGLSTLKMDNQQVVLPVKNSLLEREGMGVNGVGE